jgi:hypothetical protein
MISLLSFRSHFAMDNPLFGLFLALFGGVWLYFVFRDVVRVFERGHRGNWFVVLMGVLVFVGASGFFGAGLAAVGFWSCRIPLNGR